MLLLQARDQLEYVIPGLRDAQPEPVENVGAVKHHKEGLGIRDGVDAVVKGIRNRRGVGKPRHYIFIGIKTAQVGKRAAAGEVDRLSARDADENIRAGPGKGRLNKPGLHQA